MSFHQITVYELLTAGIILVICTIADIRRNEIVFIPCFTGILISLFFPQKNLMSSIGGALLGFVPLFVSALLGSGGGGDAIVAASVGFIYPLTDATYIFLLASAAYALVLGIAVLISKNNKKQLPYIPFLSGSWVAISALSVIQNGGILL